MYRGTTKQIAKVMKTVWLDQISEIPAGATVTGEKPLNGYVYVYAGIYGNKAWKAGYTKSIWLSGYIEITVMPPPINTKTPFSLKLDGYKLFNGELDKE